MSLKGCTVKLEMSAPKANHLVCVPNFVFVLLYQVTSLAFIGTVCLVAVNLLAGCTCILDLNFWTEACDFCSTSLNYHLR